ncbi:tyrosine-type recombinase/integrase [Paludisphaera mucosa]|uniref:Tyrosine-type recombinase/integrase n=1 Tax=Paludisphaera mucosa TaxID=3030827 RepID=A0ABT6F632_9BACT|nr:tyrosine-type recombinase/integrase [Paludisphaera mucosa]MDG3002869.1 tyrosine-type recombinase/integrase [Paludisphaera mucosa]
MARPNSPWWWADRGRWAATIDGKRQAAPKEIAQRDEAGAWAWLSSLQAAARKDSEAAAAPLAVAEVFESYLEHLAERVARGDFTEGAYEVTVNHLTTACKFAIGGVKFGAIPAGELGNKHLQAVLDQWARRPGHSAATVSSSHLATASRRVMTALRWAAREGRIPAFPLEGFKAPKVQRRDVEILTRGHAAAWLRWLHRRSGAESARNFTLLQRVLIETGARPSEVFGATWGEVTWVAGTTPVGASYGLITRSRWKNAAKGGGPRRIILTASILRPLRRLYERLRPARGELIFRAASGNPWDQNALGMRTRRLRLQAAGAGIEIPVEGTGRLRSYAWRHTAASRYLMCGIDVATVAELLGTSADMVTKNYAHLSMAHLAAAAAAGRRGRRL